MIFFFLLFYIQEIVFLSSICKRVSLSDVYGSHPIFFKIKRLSTNIYYSINKNMINLIRQYLLIKKSFKYYSWRNFEMNGKKKKQLRKVFTITQIGGNVVKIFSSCNQLKNIPLRVKLVLYLSCCKKRKYKITEDINACNYAT